MDNITHKILFKYITVNNKRRQHAVEAFTKVLAVFLCFFLSSCAKNNRDIAGVYNYYSEDRLAMRMMAGQNTYLKIDDKQTIIYHTEINGKKIIQHEGIYHLGKDNMLNINWKTGKVPGQLKIEKEGEHYIIKIGNSLYRKSLER